MLFVIDRIMIDGGRLGGGWGEWQVVGRHGARQTCRTRRRSVCAPYARFSRLPYLPHFPLPRADSVLCAWLLVLLRWSRKLA
jgi:hypothetical protein